MGDGGGCVKGLQINCGDGMKLDLWWTSFLLGAAHAFPSAQNGYQVQKEGIDRVYQTAQKQASDSKIGAEEGFKTSIERIQKSEADMVRLSTDLFLKAEETNKKSM